MSGYTADISSVSSITPHTATINLRLPTQALPSPPIPAAPVDVPSSEIVYRAKYLDTAAPVPWSLHRISCASAEQDWFGQVQLEGLQSGIMYDCECRINLVGRDRGVWRDLLTIQDRIKKADGGMWPAYSEAPLNFTTTPDPRLASKSSFKFIHAG